MPRSVSRSAVAARAKYLRKSNGQFNGSIGSGQPLTAFGRRQANIDAQREQLLKELSPRERKELVRVLRQRGKTKKPGKASTVTTERQQHLETIARINKKPASELTSADKFERKIAETRLKQLDKRELLSEPIPVTRVTDVVGDRIPKSLNPQVQNNTELLPQVNQTVNKTKLSLSARGFEAEIAYDKSTSVKLDKDFRYKVTHEGKEVTLNDNALTISHKGEVVKGVPNIVGDFKTTDNQTLVEKIALAERETKKGRAPTWNTDEHGAIVGDSSLVGKSSAAGGTNYRGMQLHHVNQWAKHPASEIEADFKLGKIDANERERRYLDTIEPNKYKGATDKAEYMLKLKPKGEREFVVLPGGLHQGGTPLYAANHPYFYDPSKGKFGAIGIPKKGDGGRQWFERQFRGSFWKEYAKVQLAELTKEANARIKAGTLSPAQAKAEYDKAVAKMNRGELLW